MPRPSQCRVCGMFEHCLFPLDMDCAERPEKVNAEAEKDND